METTEENMIETKHDNSLNKETEMGIKGIARGHHTTIKEEEFKSDKIANPQPYEELVNTNRAPFDYVLMESASNTKSKNKICPVYQKKENLDEYTMNVVRIDNNQEVASINLEACRHKRKLLSKSSFSLDDGDKEIIVPPLNTNNMPFKDQGTIEKGNESLKPDNNSHLDSSKTCKNCTGRKELYGNLFFVSHNPKSPVYSLLNCKNKIKYIENIRKLDTDIDSAYEDDYYSPCPTTTDSVATKTFDFDDLEIADVVISSKQMLDTANETQQMNVTLKDHPLKFSQNSRIDSRNDMSLIENSCCNCKAFSPVKCGSMSNVNDIVEIRKSSYERENLIEDVCDISKDVSNCKMNGIYFLKKTAQISLNKTKNITTECKSKMVFAILEPPMPKKMERRKDNFINELAAQNETYV